MHHAINLLATFQRVDNKPPKTTGTKNPKKNHRSDDVDKILKHNSQKTFKLQDNKVPVCRYLPHNTKGYKDFLSDCSVCPENEKKALKISYADEKSAKKAKTGPPKLI